MAGTAHSDLRRSTPPLGSLNYKHLEIFEVLSIASNHFQLAAQQGVQRERSGANLKESSVSKVCVLNLKGGGAGSTSATIGHLKGAGLEAPFNSQNKDHFAREQIQP